MDYQSAGVDLQDQNMFNAKLTAKMPWLGGYAGSYDIGDDYIVSATDGVGTKIKLYLNHKEYPGVSIKNLGHDLVSAVMNDIVCTGARPLFMNDYLSVHDLKSGDEYLELMDGIKEALLQCGPNVPLIGGETAILPGDHKKGEFNIAGFGVGVVSKREFVDGREIESGDMMVGLKSSGFHCNGYTLIRKVWEKFGVNAPKYVLKNLLAPSRIYVTSVLAVLKEHHPAVRGIAHITGGGRDNILRLLGEGLNLRPIWSNDWERPDEFDWIQEKGEISDEEMKRVFNDGIGMILVVDKNSVVKIVEQLTELGESPIICGRVEKRLAKGTDAMRKSNGETDPNWGSPTVSLE